MKLRLISSPESVPAYGESSRLSMIPLDLLLHQLHHFGDDRNEIASSHKTIPLSIPSLPNRLKGKKTGAVCFYPYFNFKCDPFNLRSFLKRCGRGAACSSHPCDLWDPCGVSSSCPGAMVVDGGTVGTLARRRDTGRKTKQKPFAN